MSIFTASERCGVPLLLRIGTLAERVGGNQRVDTSLGTFLVDIAHEELLILIIIWFEGDGTACDVGIVLDNLPTVGLHAVGLVQVTLQLQTTHLRTRHQHRKSSRSLLHLTTGSPATSM